MDDHALARIEVELYKIAETLGQPEALDNQIYRSRSDADAPELPLPIKERVKEKILALDRLLALHDRATYEEAMENFRTAMTMPQRYQISDAVFPTAVTVLNDVGSVDEQLFADLRDLTDARNTLHSLISDLEL